MIATLPLQRNATLVFCGFKIKAADIKACLLKLTDLSGALYSFSIRVARSERPRKKLIIDIEMAEGFEPQKYDAREYLHELISRLKKMQRGFREFIRTVPNEYFPELYFHSYQNVQFNTEVYCSRNKFIL